MAEMSGQVHDAALIDGELALVDGLIDRLRDGHRRLRHRMRTGARHQPDGPGVPE